MEGADNMCRDEALFRYGTQPTIRFYSWLTPTISYGYFQKHQSFKSDLAWTRVRRLTGGGAIAHHKEITFSLTGPADHAFLKNTLSLYHQIHLAWQQALHRVFDLDVFFREGHRSLQKPLWCFMGTDPLDLVTSNGKKLIGSAQRRSQNRVLLHGSLPLKTQALMGGTSLEDVTHCTSNYQKTLKSIKKPFLEALNIAYSDDFLTLEEESAAKKIRQKRYTNNHWVEDYRNDAFRHCNASPDFLNSVN